MTSERSLPFKTIAVWACIIVGGLITACFSLISLVSIWEGLMHIHRSGSWVPIVAGTLAFGLALWLYVRSAKAIHGLLNSEELLNL
jgi:tetrahydromethanopterin S-methyltransferase subunit E